MVVADGAAAGFLRFDRSGEGVPVAYELSIASDSSRHGEGVGLAALSLARRMMPGADLVARVLPENEASLRLFTAAGFAPESPDWLRSRAA